MSYIYNRVQSYSENSEIKYPLDDSSSGQLRSDALLDLSIGLPTNLFNEPVWMTCFKSGPTGVFVTFEQEQRYLAYIYEPDPKPFKIYQLTGDGIYGTIVFGPGVLLNNQLIGVRELVDKRCLFPGFDSGLPLTLSVNGFEYPMPSVLKIQVNDFLCATIENRRIGATAGRCLTLCRNDAKLSETIVKTGLTELPAEIPLATIANVKPDSSGNIDIKIGAPADKVWLVPIKIPGADVETIGLLIMTADMIGCTDPYKKLMRHILPSLEGYGISIELPLDTFLRASN